MKHDEWFELENPNQPSQRESEVTGAIHLQL